MAAASPAAAAALATSGLVGSLVALLEAPVTQISPDAKLDVLAFFRKAAGRQRVREAVSRGRTLADAAAGVAVPVVQPGPVQASAGTVCHPPPPAI